MKRKQINIIFFGLGSIGQKHAAILQKEYQHNLYAYRSGTNNLKNSLGINELFSWDEVYKLKPEVAFITNPTSLHIETAIKCAEIGCKLFIEKPIGKDLYELDKLLKLVKKKNLVTYVGYQLRFHPVIIKLKDYFRKYKFLHLRTVCTSYFPLWRPTQDYLKSYSASVKLGGGVILDLSHEIDYVSYLLGEVLNIKGNFSKRSGLTIDTEDNADLLLNTKKGPANIHINFLSHLRQRLIQIDFEEITVLGDIINSEIREYKKEQSAKKFTLDYHKNLEYEEQMRYFMNNLKNPLMMNNLMEVSILYKKIIKFKNSNG